MTRPTFLSIGECMIEMASTGGADYRLGFAGDTLNTAWYARAALPADWQVAYFTRLGRDPYSDRIRAFLDQNDIGTDFIATDPIRQPGLYLIEIENGERRFSYWRSASAARGLADDPAALTAALALARVAYVSGITLAILAPDRRQVLLDALAQARAAGVLTVFDPNIRPRLWEDADTLRTVTMQAATTAAIALPSFEDEASLFGDPSPEVCAARYAAAGCETVVVKNGGADMVTAEGGVLMHIGGLPRLVPLDTTGAGDAFNGGLLAALLTGAPLATAVARAHALSCRVIRHYGALIPMQDLRSAS